MQPSFSRSGPKRSQHTRVKIEFYSDTGFAGTVYSDPAAPFQLVGMQTSKRIGSSRGSITLTVKVTKRQHSLHRLWDDPEDVWFKLFEIQGHKEKVVTWGLIDTIHEDTSTGPDGATTTTFRIQASDIGKVFDSTGLHINLYQYQNAKDELPLTAILNSQFLNDPNGTPDETVRKLVVSWLGNEGKADKQWRLPKGLANVRFFFDALVLKLNKTAGMITDPSLVNPDQQGSVLWEAISHYSNPLMNELWADINPDDGKPTLYLRERPFPYYDKQQGGVTRTRWESIPTVRLTLNDKVKRSLTKGSPESRFNFWSIDGEGISGRGFDTKGQIQYEARFGQGNPGSVPIWNAESMRKHGFRRWERSTNAIPIQDKIKVSDTVGGENLTPLELAARWLGRLHDWYVIAPQQLSGTLTTGYLRSDIRVGTRLIEEREDGVAEYYVEGVDNTYNYTSGSSSTSITVTRGEFRSNPLLKTYYTQILGSVDWGSGFSDEDTFLREDVPDQELGIPPDVTQSVDPSATEDARTARGQPNDETIRDEKTVVDNQSTAEVSSSETVEGDTSFSQKKLERQDPIPTPSNPNTEPQDKPDYGSGVKGNVPGKKR